MIVQVADYKSTYGKKERKMYLHKAEASAENTLRATTISTITIAETRVIVSLSVCVRSSEQESDVKWGSSESDSFI